MCYDEVDFRLDDLYDGIDEELSEDHGHDWEVVLEDDLEDARIRNDLEDIDMDIDWDDDDYIFLPPGYRQ